MANVARDLDGEHITSGDIARSLNVDLKTVHRWVRRGSLRGRRTKGGHLRFRRIEVVRFLRHRRRQIPEAMRVASPQVIAVGSQSAGLNGSVRKYSDGMFDALLELATGVYDIAVVDVDDVDVEASQAFAQALRGHASTEEVALIGISRWPDRRHALLAAGADLVVASGRELTAAISFITGEPVPEQAPAAEPSRTAELRPLREPTPVDTDDHVPDSRALAV